MPPSPVRENIGKLIVPGLIGNIFEWYDFTIYGFLASLVAKNFFPVESETTGLILTFGVFAVGFILRPLGAAFFGHFGDRYGRKKSLLITIILMSIATTVIGLLPTYQSIGVWAAILLTLCRLVQGFACGGQFSGSMVYIAEHAEPRKRGFCGSFTLFGCYTGILLSSLVSTIVLNLAENPSFSAQSWRIPFLFGSVLGVIGIYLRLKMAETPQFLELSEAKKQVKSPLWISLVEHPVLLLKALGVTMFVAVSSYLTFVYMPTYITQYTTLPLKTAILINTLGMLTALPTVLLAGYLCDKFGRKPLLLAGAIGCGILTYPLLALIHHYGTFTVVLIVQCALCMLTVTAEGVIPATLTEIFPTQIRYTAMSLPYNIANGLFGGTAPLIVTLLIARTHNIMAPSFYVILAAAISIVSVWQIKETYRTALA